MVSCVVRMAERILHRGPDAGGEWSDPDAGIALGHRRLSIIDLSETGRQPMTSSNGRFIMVFNGEVYNFKAIRMELSRLGATFKGGSDTEVMLESFSRWGIAESVKRFRGMFSFAVWDRDARSLNLCRDRIGEKPLYYGWAGKVFLFGSELKAFHAYRNWVPEVDRDSLALYFKRSCIPAPYSIFSGIRKLPPGTLLEVPISASAEKEGPDPAPYWSMKDAAESGISNRFKGSEEDAANQLEQLLLQTVGDQMISDVPLGAFLSGGLDSSLVVALMQAQSRKSIRTFTIGFHEKSYDEAAHAKAIASHLGTEHTEMYVGSKDALKIIPSLPDIYDEPFADSSQIPTLLISALTRKHVTVCLSGDGGDELMGGYNRYIEGPKLWRKVGALPYGIRKNLYALLNAVPASVWEKALAALEPILPLRAKQLNISDKMEKVLNVLAVKDATGIYHALVTHWKDSAKLVPG
ncbi:MAG: asparagine synthase (glutamine-hydrolyzing), partial [Fibrobacterota bacterium]|nr:asparagine synthase (glutamine-hydrolyzing) [Fibrobacterota bacterium]